MNEILNAENRRRRMACARVVLVACALGMWAGCGPQARIAWRLHAELERTAPAVVVFLVDGLAPRYVEEGCAAGRLPHIQRHFCMGGTQVQNAMSCVPSITYASIASMLTGTQPARHAIIGNRWFDPEEGLFRNYTVAEHYRTVNADLHTPTLYERLAPLPSASIQAAHVRGVTHDVANWAVSGVMWFFGNYTAVDKLTATSIAEVARWANWEGRWPTLLTCYFPGLDTVGHVHGASSPEYQWALEHIDRQIGRICDWLAGQGLLEQTYLVLISDHGMTDVRHTFKIGLLELVRDQWGRCVTGRMLQDGLPGVRQAYFARFDTVVDTEDGRRASLHFRGPGEWAERPSFAEVEAILTTPPVNAQLWNVKGVELVAYLASWDEAWLRSSAGAARVVMRTGPSGSEFAYIPEPNDVLGYLEDPNVAAFVAEGFHGSRAWLEATSGQHLPDVVPHMVPLLRVRRAGQVLVFADTGYSFQRENGGHGGLDREEMRITLMFSGPGVCPGGTIPTGRVEDLTPTILDLLGRKADSACFDGISLVESGLLRDARGGARR